jgi:hypothetical protein
VAGEDGHGLPGGDDFELVLPSLRRRQAVLEDRQKEE